MDPETLSVDDRVTRVLHALDFMTVRQFGLKDQLAAAIEGTATHFVMANQALESMQAASEVRALLLLGPLLC